MKNNELTIWGAGIAGLLAANAFQTARIYERTEGPTEGGNHKALLRFRSPAVGDAVGVEFRKVKVYKGIWHAGSYVQPSILHANAYSQKVIGRLADRSIWSTETVERWIAPEDFYEQLLQRVGARVVWGVDALAVTGRGEPVVSTLPMSALAQALRGKLGGVVKDLPKFERQKISVRRWIIPGADVHQTVYVPDPGISCYRASITGNVLIAEYVGDAVGRTEEFEPGQPFGISTFGATELPVVRQSFGKIQPIDEAWRKNFILRLSNEHNIFSLGRFGTWRNLLLDDVLHDIAVVKRLLAADAYGRQQHNVAAR